MSAIGDEIYCLGLKELRAREEETRAFEDCVRGAQTRAQEEGVRVVDEFLEDKDAVFDQLYEVIGRMEERGEAEEVTELQRAEVERLREHLAARIREVWAQVMAVEVTLVNQTEAVLERFEANMTEMMDKFTKAVHELFARARAVDTRYR